MTKEPLAFYYGAERTTDLLAYQRVVLQPQFYSSEELAFLTGAGTQPLAYLSLSEDEGPPGPWQRADRDPDWGSALVYVDDPRWVTHVTDRAARALEAGFGGLFLDTLNAEWTHPEDIPHLLALVAALREQSGSAYLLANRGFALLPALAEFVNGVVFESFSVRWVTEGYAPWPTDILEGHAKVAEQLLAFDLDLYALDYADDPAMAAFARRRAGQFGMSCFVSDRALSRIGERTPAS